MTNPVTYSRSGLISRIVMDDGKANVMSIGMLNALHAAFDETDTRSRPLWTWERTTGGAH